MSDLKALENEVARLWQEYKAAKTRLDDARAAAAEFKVGDVVQTQLGSQWVEVIVRSVEPHSWGPWYVVSKRRKDGSWSKASQRTFGDVRRHMPASP